MAADKHLELRSKDGNSMPSSQDATTGEAKDDSLIFGHNDLSMTRMIRRMNQTLATEKIRKPDAKIILNKTADKKHRAVRVLKEKLLPEGLIPPAPEDLGTGIRIGLME